MKPLEDLSVVPDKSFFRPELIVVDVPYSPLETKMRKMAKRSWMQDNERTWNDAVPWELLHSSSGQEKEMPIDHMKEVLNIRYDD